MYVHTFVDSTDELGHLLSPPHEWRKTQETVSQWVAHNLIAGVRPPKGPSMRIDWFSQISGPQHLLHILLRTPFHHSPGRDGAWLLPHFAVLDAGIPKDEERPRVCKLL